MATRFSSPTGARRAASRTSSSCSRRRGSRNIYEFESRMSKSETRAKSEIRNAKRTRILGVDPGKVRIGLAVTDAERRLASPLTIYARKNDEQDEKFFKQIAAGEEIGLLLIGLPMHTTGREGVQADAARALGAKLQTWTGLPV